MILTMITTALVMVIGIMIGYRLGKGDKPVVLPDVAQIKEHIPLTKEHKQKSEDDLATRQAIDKFNESVKYVENFK